MQTLAYLDAGTGSMIAQAVVAGGAGVAVVAKIGWRRMAAPFTKGSRRPASESHSDAPPEAVDRIDTQ